MNSSPLRFTRFTKYDATKYTTRVFSAFCVGKSQKSDPLKNIRYVFFSELSNPEVLFGSEIDIIDILYGAMVVATFLSILLPRKD